MHVAALFKTRDRYRVLECSPNIISCSRCPVQKDTLFKTLEVIFSHPLLLLLLLLLLFCLWSSSSLFYSWSSFFLFPTDRPGSFNSISFWASLLPGKDLSLVLFFSVRPLFYWPTSSSGFTEQGPPVFVYFFFRSSSRSVPASSVLSCQAEIALSLGLISCPQLMRFKSRGPSVLAVCLGYVTEMHCSRRPWKTP